MRFSRVAASVVVVLASGCSAACAAAPRPTPEKVAAAVAASVAAQAPAIRQPSSPGTSPSTLPPDVLVAGLSADATPTLLTIPALRVRAPIVATGADADGTPQMPPFDRPGEVGWYTRTATPGSAGAAVVWGHLDTRTGTAIFLDLSTLAKGDLVQVSRDDGAVATFTVERSAAYAKDDFPGDLVYDDPGYPALRLITCGGGFDRKAQTYGANLVVFARLTSVTAPLVPVPHPAPVDIPIPHRPPAPTPTLGRPTPTPTPSPSPGVPKPKK